MSETLPIISTVEQAHRQAIEDVNRWRGHCVECFARIEQSIAATLSALAGESTASVPHVFGQRLKRLRDATSPEGPHPCSRILKTLDEMSHLLDQRNRIVHATAHVYVDARGGWLWRFTFLPAKAGAAPEIGSMDTAEAGTFEKDLKRRSQSLCAQLEALRRKLAE